MNIKLLRRVQKAILAEPEHFDMGWWFGATRFRSCSNENDYNNRVSINPIADNKKQINACSTAACIAGWTWKITKFELPVLRSGYMPNSDAIAEFVNQAARELDLNRVESGKLFYLDGWPAEIYDAYEEAKNAYARADVAYRAIEDFIFSDGWEGDY